MKTHQITVCVHRSVRDGGIWELDDLVEITLNREQFVSLAATAAQKIFAM